MRNKKLQFSDKKVPKQQCFIKQFVTNLWVLEIGSTLLRKKIDPIVQ
jgi:hypothetical protein